MCTQVTRAWPLHPLRAEGSGKMIRSAAAATLVLALPAAQRFHDWTAVDGSRRQDAGG